MTLRIGRVRKFSPDTEFWVDADWVDQDSGGNYSILGMWVKAGNGPGGNSGSNFLAEGYQNVHANGYVGEVRRNPFLPSGYNAGQERWNVYFEKRFYHDGNGNGPSVNLGMELGYGSINDRYDNGRAHTGSIGAPPRIGRAPGKTPRPSASDITATGTKLAWSAADRGHADIVEYQVQRSLSSSFSSPTTTSTGTSRSLNVTGLTAGTEYFYRVRARNGDGWGAWSDTRSARTLPAAPSALTVTSGSPTSLSASWNAPAGGAPIDYQVAVARNSDMSDEVAAPILTGRSANINALAPGTPYWVRVRARNSTGWGAWSGIVPASTLSAAYVGKGGSFPPSAGVFVGTDDAFIVPQVLVGKGEAFVNAG